MSIDQPVSILLISDHNGFRVPFTKIASVYFIPKYIYTLAVEMTGPWNQHCANSIGTVSFSLLPHTEILFTPPAVA